MLVSLRELRVCWIALVCKSVGFGDRDATNLEGRGGERGWPWQVDPKNLANLAGPHSTCKWKLAPEKLLRHQCLTGIFTPFTTRTTRTGSQRTGSYCVRRVPD